MRTESQLQQADDGDHRMHGDVQEDKGASRARPRLTLESLEPRIMLSGSTLEQDILVAGGFVSPGGPLPAPIVDTVDWDAINGSSSTDAGDVTTVDAGDYYLSGPEGVRQPLLRVTDEVVVKVSSTENGEAVIAEFSGDGGVLAGFTQVRKIESESIYTLKAPAGTVLDIDGTVGSLQEIASVEWASPSFVHAGGTRTVPTNEVIVKAPGVEGATFFEGSISWRMFTPDTWVVTVPGGPLGALSASVDYYGREEVVWAEPNAFDGGITWYPIEGDSSPGTTDAGDYYLSGVAKTVVSLVRVNGKVSVKFSSAAGLELQVSQLIAPNGALGGFEVDRYVNPEDGLVVFKASDIGSFNLEGSLQALRGVEGVAWAGPAFVKAGSTHETYLTDEFFVKLENAAEAEDLLGGFASYRGFTPDTFIVRLAAGPMGVLDASVAMCSQEGVIWAEPNFYTVLPWDGPFPELHLKLDETTGSSADDASPNHWDGTLINMEDGDWVDGVWGNGLSFDGTNEYVTVADQDALDPGTGDFAVALWFYRESGGDYERVISKGAENTSDEGWAIRASDTQVVVLLRDGSTTKQVTADHNGTSRWTHVAVNMDRDGDLEVYIDGVLQDAVSLSSYSATDVSTAKALEVGPSTSAGNYWPGDVDDVRVYDRTLSQEEITALVGPVAYWRLDESSGTTASDETGDHDGTTSGGPTWVMGQDGTGYALSFDGSDDYVSVPDSQNLDIGEYDFAIAMWINADAGNSFTRIISKGGESLSDEGYAIAINGATLYGLVREGDGSTQGYVTASITGTGEWNHIVLNVNRDGDLELYVNGIAGTPDDISTSLDGVDISTGDNVNIGRNVTWANGYYSGMVDDVQIYSRALSLTEITALAGTPTAWWKLDETSGTNADEEMQNDHDGTLHNMTDADWVDSVRANGLEFDGSDDYVSVTDHTDLDPGTEDFAVALWFYRDSGDDWERVISKGAHNINDKGWAIYASDTEVAAILRKGDGSTQGAVAGNHSGTGAWTHVAMNVDRDGNLTLYVNGESVGTPASLSAFEGYDLTTSNDLNIGRSTGAAYYWPGKVDDVHIYNRILGSDELAELNHAREGHWRFNEASGDASDSSGNNYTGTVSGATVVAGQDGNGLDFDGTNDYVSVADKDDLDIGTGDFSIAMWVKADAGNVFTRIISKGADSLSDEGYAIAIYNTTLYGLVRVGDGSTQGYVTTTITGTGEWNHVVLNVDLREDLELYINGKLESTDDISTSLSAVDISTADNVNIGRNVTSGSGYYDGVIDDVRISKKVLSDEEIMELAGIVDFDDYTIATYNSESGGTAAIEDGGRTLKLTGDGWRKIQFTHTYNVTANTVIEFRFKSADEGEIHSIGFDDDDSTSSSANETFQLYGSETWDIQTYNDYSGSDWTLYTITVGGGYDIGLMDYLVFINDNDAGTGEGYFSDVRIYEAA